MAPQLYLITPQTADPARFPAMLMGVLSAASFSALLVSRGERTAEDYARLAAEMINIGQGAGCAVLLEDDVALARRLGADGVHVTGGAEDVAAALAVLKPDMIVGAGPVGSRHDAMTMGELGVDYLFFGSGELAQWWAETFEIPAVLSLPAATAEDADARGAEFAALSDSVWSAPAPAQAAQAIAAGMQEAR